MNGRILPFEARGHDEAQRLLPWLVNGHLEEPDRSWVDAHVAGCADCRHERELLETLQAVCQQDEESDDGADAAWRRLRARVRPGTTGRTPDPWWRGWGRAGSGAPSWVGWALAAQAAVLVVGGAFVVAGLPRDATPPAPRYHTLGTASAGSLMVMIDPAMREAQWRGLLQASGARIVDGPNAAGAYMLAVPAARTARACDALRAAPGVLLVERIDGVHDGCAP